MPIDPDEAAVVDEGDGPNADISGGDLYPGSAEAHAKLLDWCNTQFIAASTARKPIEQRWRRYDKLYRAYVKRTEKDWHSKVFIPIAFYVIEAIVPRMVAQLPKFTVEAVGPEDVEGAKVMEELLGWAARRTRLHLELVKAYRCALKYGTGILQDGYRRKTKQVGTFVQEQAPAATPTPILDPMTGQPMMDLNGAPMMDINAAPMNAPGPEPTGKMVRQMQERVFYDGPFAEFVDIFNFWVAPEATSIEDARYVIVRHFRDNKYVQRKLDDGLWKLPSNMSKTEDLTTSKKDDRTQLREETGDSASDPTRNLVEVLTFWTDEAQIVVINGRAVVRVDTNPYEHGEKPFTRYCDYFQEGSFWGIGELEPLEGMQEIVNALWNQRIDNVRLVLNKMFAYDPDNIHDTRELQIRPGGSIRVRSRDLPPRSVLQDIEFADVTQSAYSEVSELERMTEKVSGVSAYTTGGDSPTMNNTATGVSLITEQGNSRFSLKVRMAELTGLVPLARHWGAILQQFLPDSVTVGILDAQSQQTWKTITAESLQGMYDYDIQAESSTVTESVRKEQSMSLLQTFAQVLDPSTGQPIVDLRALAKDVLEAFSIKDAQRYLTPAVPQQQMLPGMQQPPGMDPNALLAQLQGGPPQGGPPQGPPQAGPPQAPPQNGSAPPPQGNPQFAPNQPVPA